LTTSRSASNHPATLSDSERGQPGRRDPPRQGDRADTREANAMSPTAGITQRTDRNGRTRYQVRVRRAGTSQTATLPGYEAALVWRAQALSAVDGLTAPRAVQSPQRRSRLRGTLSRLWMLLVGFHAA